MAERALDEYLNDHLAGSVVGCRVAARLAKGYRGGPFGAEMADIAAQVREDKATLEGLMERLGTSRSRVKPALAGIADSVGRLKLRGVARRGSETGLFLALETLSMGVEGKVCLWEALRTLAPDGGLRGVDLQELIGRGQRQRAALELERLAVAARVLGGEVGP